MNPDEQQAVQDLIDEAQQLKDKAQAVVNDLPDGAEQNGYQGRLNGLTDLEAPAVSEELENFKIIVKVDGKEVQVSDFEDITYSDFVNHLATLTEAKLAEDLTYVSTDFDGNTVTLSFETAAEAEKPAVSAEEAAGSNPGVVKPVDPTDANQGTGIVVTNPDKDTTVTATDEDGKEIPAVMNKAVQLGNKKAIAKKESKYAKDAHLPSTGDDSSATFAIAGLAIIGLGLAGTTTKRKCNK